MHVARDQASLSERRACGLLDVERATVRYRRRERDDELLRGRLRERAAERRRFGYRRLHLLLDREGWKVNHKRVYRLYRGEGLTVRRRKRKRAAARERVPLASPLRQAGEMLAPDATAGLKDASGNAPSSSGPRRVHRHARAKDSTPIGGVLTISSIELAPLPTQ